MIVKQPKMGDDERELNIVVGYGSTSAGEDVIIVSTPADGLMCTEGTSINFEIGTVVSELDLLPIEESTKYKVM